MQYVLLTILLTFSLVACSEEPVPPDTPESADLLSPAPSPAEKGCRPCHKLTLDPNHRFDCVACHGGTQDSSDKDQSHDQMIAKPARPETMARVCGGCHPAQVKGSSHSIHFTLQNEVNTIRKSFGAKVPLASLLDIPSDSFPDTVLGLADDLLRRRCLRCHPYFSGDPYPATTRGMGCSSCHLQFFAGKLVSHAFLKSPGDTQCLQCHYGNWVGSDYYGRYEHDLNEEYRTPYTTRQDYFRPFGVEFHQLSADIHQQRGLICIDCHGGPELMATSTSKIRCASCHDNELIAKAPPLPSISHDPKDGSYRLLSAGDGKEHPIPMMTDPAHTKYGMRVHCQVCHAQWSYNDTATHLLRSDLDDYDAFSRVTVQGSFEVERILTNNLDFEAEEMAPRMSDKINGEPKQGLWYKGYGTRRWEQVTIGRDATGQLQVMRPLLDLYLSWIDNEEEVRFDSIGATAPNHGLLPYVPHTTGKAGFFYRERIENFLQKEKESASSK